jgi:peptidoglycan/LPS O-acetylase OafA/YrhL
MYFFLVVLWALKNRGRRVCAFLRSRFLVYIGGLCFGLYLLQRPSEVLLLKGLSILSVDLNALPLLSLSAKSAFAVVVAHASWKWFEKPINELKVRFSSSRHPLETACSS